jgi:hypothetical protein
MMHQEGFEKTNLQARFYKLNKAIYGLKQAEQV